MVHIYWRFVNINPCVKTNHHTLKIYNKNPQLHDINVTHREIGPRTY